MNEITIASIWTHRNGNDYSVVMIANLLDTADYPKTIVYRNIKNGTLWARRYDDWYRSFSPKLGEGFIND